MRRRRHQRGALVLTGSFTLSVLVHLAIGFPLRDLTNDFLSTGKDHRAVKVIKISPSQWAQNRTVLKQRKQPAGLRAEAAKAEAQKIEKKKAEEKKEEKRIEDKLSGQVVEVPPTADDSPNPEAKYLSKYNSHVKKETVARPDARNPRMKRVTNKLQTTEVPAAPQGALVTPGLSLKGDGLPEDRPGAKGEKKKKSGQFVLELPDLKRRESVRLKLAKVPGISQRLFNREGSEELKGNSNRMRVEMGSGGEEEGGGGKKGKKDASNKDGLPSLAALVPTVGTVARISGSPSRDHVEGVEEGDGTFLNTKEFKYATFFYRVRDSVASYWEDLAAREYRRRDPTGNIYGVRDRSTLLNIQLNRDGTLDSVRVEQTSGVEFLDTVAVKAFNMAEPFPNPPPGIADADGNIRFNFQFVVTMRSRSPLNLFR